MPWDSPDLRQFRETQWAEHDNPKLFRWHRDNSNWIQIKMFLFCSGTWYNQFTLGLQTYLRPSFPNEHVLEIFNPQKGTSINIITFGPIPDKHKFWSTRISHGTKCLHLFALLLQRVGKNPKHKYINLQIISAFRWKDGGIKTLNSDWSKDKKPVTHPNYSQEPGILTLCPLL